MADWPGWNALDHQAIGFQSDPAIPGAGSVEEFGHPF